MWFACAICVVGFGSVSAADDDRAIAAFGQGVHAFFEQDYKAADELLSEAIAAQTHDPRPYYFRGLIRKLNGDSKSGEDDFQAGAEIELSSFGRAFDVDDALERVQGPIRLQIETFRREAIAKHKANKARLQRAPKANGANGESSKGALDPSNLPDVSQIVDATIPFPEISAKPYYPPAKLASDLPPEQPVLPPANSVTPSTPINPANDPFGSGNQPSKPEEAMEPNPGQNPPPTDDDPFDSKKSDDGSNEPSAEQPPAENPAPESGNENPPPADDDPFGGG
jgi:hypothetical protein